MEVHLWSLNLLTLDQHQKPLGLKKLYSSRLYINPPRPNLGCMTEKKKDILPLSGPSPHSLVLPSNLR